MFCSRLGDDLQKSMWICRETFVSLEHLPHASPVCGSYTAEACMRCCHPCEVWFSTDAYGFLEHLGSHVPFQVCTIVLILIFSNLHTVHLSLTPITSHFLYKGFHSLDCLLTHPQIHIVTHPFKNHTVDTYSVSLLVLSARA